MADVNANIGVNIDTSLALAQLKSLQRQISQFHTSIARSSDTAALAQKSLQKNFLNSVNAIGSFSAELRTVKTTTESFTSSLEGNKFSMREYFRYAGGATKTFGKLFKSEFDTIGKVAEERVKRLQTQYIKMGRDASGAMQAISITPTALDMENYGTKTAIAAQKQALFNQLMKQGSTNLLNFGKNTQWAGRQLMVGFTIPLAMVGSAATRTFMDMEAQALKFKKVYGDLFTPKEETQQALDNITELGKSFTQYGIAVSTTVGLAAEAAAAGFSGLDLQRQTTEATRLSILGQIDSQKALETTISLQNSFGMSSDKLADSINFLNAVENQTVVSLDDITTAIPKVAPVIQQLGGDVKDLTFFMAAMKEGGINASEGANALKSGLAALINPTGRASAMLEGFGINAKKIVTDNKGNLKATVVEFATALNQLDPLNRAQAIEQMFGKFQFARLSTLFANVAKDGNQAARVLDLANSSVEELSKLSEQELGMTADSAMNKFKKTVEDLKAALIPVGKAFLEAVTPIVEFVGNILEKFSDLSAGTKKAITLMVTIVGGLGPILLMTFGLLANGVANIIKLFLTLRNGFLRLTGQSQILGDQTQYLTMEQIDAAAASHSLNQAHATLTQQFTAESAAVNQLIAAYQGATRAGAAFAMANPGAMLPRGKGYANGIVSVPGSGKGDTVPAMLTPGEAVIPADMAKKYAPLIQGMVAGNIPGYSLGKTGAGKFGVSVSKAKEDSNVYKAPSVIKPQTVDASWATMQAEIDAMTAAAEEYLREMGFNAEDIAKKIKQLVQKQASHITKQVEQIQVAGETVDVKQWNANNLIADFGGINNYLNSIHKVTETLDEQEISKLASSLNMSIDEFKTELKMLEEGIHPTTRKAGQVLGAVAKKGSTSTDKTLAYQSRAVTAGMDTRLSGDFYETVASRAYDPTKDIKSLEQVNTKIVKLKTQILDSFNIGDEIAALSGKNVEALQSAWSQLSMQAKERLIALSSDTSEFTAALMREAKEAGIAGFEVGNESVKGIARGAKTASPSKDTIKTGEDVGKGLEIGMESRKDDVAKVGESLGQIATQSTDRASRTVPRGSRTTQPITPGAPYNIQKTQGGIPISQVARNMPVSPEIVQKAALQARMMQISSDRLQTFDRKVMGASFAISSLSGLASMSGGKLGEMSGTISKVTGALFALQAVTSLLTQSKLLELAQSRIGAASTAMKMAKGTQGGGMVGVAGKAGVKGSTSIMGSLARVGLGLTKFLGPIGIATTAATVLYMGFKFYKKTQEEARLKVEGLGEAALLTSEQLGKLAPLLGFTEGPSPFANVGKETKVVSDPQRQKMDELKKVLAEDKSFQENIKAIREGTDSQIKTVLSAQSVDFLSKGAPKENVQAYIDLLLEEAGKTKVDFKVDSIDITSKEGRAGIVKSAQTQIKNFDKAYQDAIKKSKAKSKETGYTPIAGSEQEKRSFKNNLTKDQQKNLTLIPNALVANLGAIKKSLETGKIGIEDYNTAIGGLVSGLESGQGSLLVAKETIKGIALAGGDEALANAAGGITKNADAIFILQAATAGIPDIIKLINALKVVNDPTSTLQALTAAQAVIAKAEAGMAKRVAEQAKVGKVNSYVPPEDAGTPEKSPFEQATDQLKNQRTEMLNTVKAYGILTKSGVKAGKAFAIAKDPILAAAIATTKVGTAEWKKLIKLIKETDAALIKSKLTELKADTAYTKQFTAIVPVLKDLGLNAEEIDDIFSDPSFAQQFIKGIKDGKMNTKDLKTLIDETVKNREVKIKFNVSKMTEEEVFEDNMNKANEMFDKVQAGIEASYRVSIKKGEDAVEKAQGDVEDIQKEIDDIQTIINKKQRDLEIDITRKIEKFQADIDKLQNDIKTKFEEPLSKLGDEGDILSNNLSLIDRQTSKINEKYDAQAAALTKISDINSEIANQQKQQLGLADALSRGDIAAAAAAAQEMRATAAANAQGRQSGVLDAARAAELSGVTSGGMTREAIEERQFKISQESFALQQGRKSLEQDIANIEKNQIAPLNVARLAAETAIRVEEDRIYNIQVGRLANAQTALTKAEGELKVTQGKLKADLAIIEQNKQAWADAKTLRDLDFLEQQESAKKYKGILAESETTAKNIIAKLAEKVTTIHNIHTTYTSSGSSGASTTPKSNFTYNSGNPLAKMYGGKIMPMNYGGMVPKYMAVGGRVGSDTVPAMLTPGEFVMNKAATKRFGPMLENMNNSKYPSMIKDLTPTTYTNVNSSISMPISSNLSSTINDNSSTMYNYNVGINVNESNASSNDIARAVIGQIKYIDSQRIRGQR
jgi:TP901 family phage tail tape measure protein